MEQQFNNPFIFYTYYIYNLLWFEIICSSMKTRLLMFNRFSAVLEIWSKMFENDSVAGSQCSAFTCITIITLFDREFSMRRIIVVSTSNCFTKFCSSRGLKIVRVWYIEKSLLRDFVLIIFTIGIMLLKLMIK